MKAYSRNNRRKWVWVAVLVLVAVGCRLSTPETGTSAIVYVGMDDNIYTIGQDGENKQTITSDAGGAANRVYQQPTWSPDSKRIAFIQTDRGNDGSQTGTLFTSQLDGGDLVETFSSEEQFPFYLYWSPDSQRVSFLTTGGSESGLVLYMVPAQGGEAQELGIGQPYYWAWSPDSQSILTHTGGSARFNPEARLATLDLDGEALEAELELQPAAFQAPAWSPDGERFLLAAKPDGEEEGLLLTDTKGEILSVLSPVDDSIAFSWSPDGNWIAYVTEDNRGPGELSRRLVYLDAAQAAEPQMVEHNLVIAYFWSPDSRKIAYFLPEVNLSSEQPEVSLQTQEAQFNLELFILDVETGSSQRLIEYTPTDDFLNILPFFDQYQRSATIWSPDSSSLVITAIEPDGENVIYTIEASGNAEARRLASGSLAFWSWE
jgi:TolB protein